MKYLKFSTGIVWLFLLCFGLLWPLESAGSPRNIQWGIGVGIRTPGHGQEVDFTCGPEIQPRARFQLSERFSLDFAGHFNTARTLLYKNVSQTALGLTVTPMYFFTPVEYAETNGRTFVGFGPVFRLSKKHGHILWGEFFDEYGLENTEYADYRFEIDDKWDPTFGISFVLGGEIPISSQKTFTLDIRYMYFLDEEENYGVIWNGSEDFEEEMRAAGWVEDYHGDLVPRKVMAISVGVLF